MPSGTPPTSRTSTKYEDIPPRFRKLWIEGNAESVQKKLDAPVEGFSFSTPLQHSNSETNLSSGIQNSYSRSQSVGASGGILSSSSSPPPLHKRPRTGDFSLSDTASNHSGDSGLLEKEKNAFSDPIAYSGASSMQRIINSVVYTNVSRSTPSTSRSTSPVGNLNHHSKYRPPSRSRPTTRSNSPNVGARSLTPTPSGWTPLTSRHSLRRFDIRPWGPRHLEYDYNEARKEFQGAAYFALGQYGYVPPKGIAKFKAPAPEELPSMSDLRKIPDFSKACRRLDAADRALEEALARGETWVNAPIPDEYVQFSLETLSPDGFCTHRPGNAMVQERSRSSVTLEEAAGQMKPSLLNQSATTSTSTPTSASASESSSVSIFVDEAKSSENLISLTQMHLGDEQPSSSSGLLSESRLTNATSPGSIATQKKAQDVFLTVSVSTESGSGPSAANSDVSPLQLVRKRLLEEIESDGGLGEEKERSNSSDTSRQSKAPTRNSSPAPTPASSERAARRSIGRATSESTSGSGSGSISGDDALIRESPPTSISTSISKSERSDIPTGRVARMRGRKRRAGGS